MAEAEAEGVPEAPPAEAPAPEAAPPAEPPAAEPPAAEPPAPAEPPAEAPHKPSEPPAPAAEPPAPAAEPPAPAAEPPAPAAEPPAAEPPAAEAPPAEPPAAEAPPAEAPPAGEPRKTAEAPPAGEPRKTAEAPPAGEPRKTAEPKAESEQGAPAPPSEASTPAEAGAPAPAKSVAPDAPRADIRKESVDDRRSSQRFGRLSQIKPPSKLELRGQSKGRMVSIQIRRPSNLGAQLMLAKQPKFMNSYKLDSDNPFNVDKVYGIIKKIITDQITDTYTYDPNECATRVKVLSNMIRGEVKSQEYERFKLVCLVTIGEKQSYDIFTGVRFLWDSERDRYATFMHENMHLFCVASVFGLYYE